MKSAPELMAALLAIADGQPFTATISMGSTTTSYPPRAVPRLEAVAAQKSRSDEKGKQE